MKWENGDFWITDDLQVVDLDFVVTSLNTTYWAKDRPRAVIEASIKNSVVLSLFKNNKQIGLTRVVSDYASFAWICDVYVHPDYRGNGLGVWLMTCTLEHPSTNVNLIMLSTKDAHGLYKRFNFKRGECMKKRKNVTAQPPPKTTP
jgi:GNAT superfamily N-acetyltransferase